MRAGRYHRAPHVVPALGLRFGTPQKASAALGVVLGEDWQKDGRDHSRNVALFAEPGLRRGRASLAYVGHGYGSFGSGFGVAATVLRTWSDPWQLERNSTYVGGEVIVWPILFVGPRIGLFRNVSSVETSRSNVVLELRASASGSRSAMTNRLYYTDAYRSEFTANVVAPSDDGLARLSRRNGLLSDVRRPAARPRHARRRRRDRRDRRRRSHRARAGVAAAGVDAARRGTIDWTRRFDHMQQHTGQHLLSAVFEDLFGFKTVSVHFGPD